MKVQITLTFTLPQEAVEEAERNGTAREDMPQVGADNIKQVLALGGLNADTAVGVEVTE